MSHKKTNYTKTFKNNKINGSLSNLKKNTIDSHYYSPNIKKNLISIKKNNVLPPPSQKIKRKLLYKKINDNHSKNAIYPTKIIFFTYGNKKVVKVNNQENINKDTKLNVIEGRNKITIDYIAKRIDKKDEKKEKNKINVNYIERYKKEEYNNNIIDQYYNKRDGFSNIGSTCFFNSFLQILLHVPGLIKSLKDYDKIFDKNSLIYYLLNVADNPSYQNLKDLKSMFIKINSNYGYYSQEDSQEFGAEFLKILNNELSIYSLFIGIWDYKEEFKINNNSRGLSRFIKGKKDKLNNILNDKECEFKFETIITDMFYFIESILITSNNKVLNINYYGDVDNQLSFDLKNNIYYSNELYIYDMLKIKYLKNNKLIKLPKVLMITLLRAIIKEPLINTIVKINEEIDLKDFIDKDFGNYSKPTTYTLYALNVCIGNNKKYGHYYAYIKINDEWYKFDDKNVEKENKNTIQKDLPYIYGIYYINKEYLKNYKENYFNLNI